MTGFKFKVGDAVTISGGIYIILDIYTEINGFIKWHVMGCRTGKLTTWMPHIYECRLVDQEEFLNIENG
jgi:hypothetical protein